LICTPYIPQNVIGRNKARQEERSRHARVASAQSGKRRKKRYSQYKYILKAWDNNINTNKTDSLISRTELGAPGDVAVVADYVDAVVAAAAAADSN